MRDIEFMAWDKDKERMIQPEEICRLHFVAERGLYCITLWDGSLLLHFELLQYIRRDDKAGRKIFEGHIVKGQCDNDTDIGEVRYDSTSSEWVLYQHKRKHGCYPLRLYHDLEILGHIKTNPELLPERRNAYEAGDNQSPRH